MTGGAVLTSQRAASPSINPGWFVAEMTKQMEMPAAAGKDDVESVASMVSGIVSRPDEPQRIGYRGAGLAKRTHQAFSWSISPGVVGVKAGNSESGIESVDEPVEENRQGVLFDIEEEKATRGMITEWSRASRARMHRSIGEMDFSTWNEDGGVLAMVTLTLPGHWEAIAPTGRDFKQLMRVWQKRWQRSIKIPFRGLWKLEFQRRGAPHLHALMRVPANVKGERFERWLSRTWADVCRKHVMKRLEQAEKLPVDEYLAVLDQVAGYEDSGDFAKHELAGTGVDFSGVKFSDPRRTAIYFGKHSTKSKDGKEYQHIVPELWQEEGAGPGRFWGVWGLDKAVAVMELTHDEFVAVRRVLRHVAKARRAVTAMNRARSADEGHLIWEMKRIKIHSLGARGGGWVLVNSGLELAIDIGRFLQARST